MMSVQQLQEPEGKEHMDDGFGRSLLLIISHCELRNSWMRHSFMSLYQSHKTNVHKSRNLLYISFTTQMDT